VDRVKVNAGLMIARPNATESYIPGAVKITKRYTPIQYSPINVNIPYRTLFQPVSIRKLRAQKYAKAKENKTLARLSASAHNGSPKIMSY
jgi:hypothetical protein